MVFPAVTPVYYNDLLFTTCTFLSGNNWSKVSLFYKFLNLCIPVDKVFNRNQNLFVSPEISSFSIEFQQSIMSNFSDYNDVVLCGDGRNDSPGHCARYCTYVIMEHFLKVKVDLEVIDCKETGGVSTNMERDALVRLLKVLRHQLSISEITTDASGKLSGKYPALCDLVHSLDVWNKAKALRKVLFNTAKISGNESIKPWIDSIVNHFWHCSQNCNRDLGQLKVKN